MLEGDRLVNTPYELKFRQDVENKVLCKKNLDAKELKAFRDAVKQDYYFQVRRQQAAEAAGCDWVTCHWSHHMACVARSKL